MSNADPFFIEKTITIPSFVSKFYGEAGKNLDIKLVLDLNIPMFTYSYQQYPNGPNNELLDNVATPEEMKPKLDKFLLANTDCSNKWKIISIVLSSILGLLFLCFLITILRKRK